MSDKKNLERLNFRYTEPGDAYYLMEWLKDPKTISGFPMCDEVEIEDAAHRWVSFSRYKCSITALMDGKPVGIATLYLQPYRKLAHQCEFGIIVEKEHQNQGIGHFLIRNLSHLAKTRFHIEVLHLTVYTTNPAINLYKREGFVEFGRQEHFTKEPDGSYTGRVFMQKNL